MASNKILTLTKDNFLEMALESTNLVVVVFHSNWSGPSKAMSSVVEELATTYTGKATIGRVDIDENPDLVNQYGIRATPTFLFLKEGREINRVVGIIQKSDLQAILVRHL